MLKNVFKSYIYSYGRKWKVKIIIGYANFKFVVVPKTVL